MHGFFNSIYKLTMGTIYRVMKLKYVVEDILLIN